MLSKVLISKVFGTLKLNEGEIKAGPRTFPLRVYEGKLSEAAGDVDVVINPEFGDHLPSDAKRQVAAILSMAEELHEQVHKLGVDGVFHIQRAEISELGEFYSYENWGTTEADLFAGWKLQQEVYFDDGFRLIYSGHPIYYLDLNLEFDLKFNPINAHFDG